MSAISTVGLKDVMERRKVSGRELSELIGISEVNVSRMVTGRTCSIRFSTLDKICRVLQCQPGDLITCIDAEKATEDTESKRSAGRKNVD